MFSLEKHAKTIVITVQIKTKKAKMMWKRKVATALSTCFLASSALATTPSGGWTLKNESLNSKDYSMRIDVDPGESYNAPGFAPSSVYWAQYVTFNQNSGGYLGLQRVGGKKWAIFSIWGGLSAKAGVLPVADCFEFSACQSIKGDYDWKVGHKYRFRVELSPRTPSDSHGDWWQLTLADLTRGTIDILGEIETPKWGGLSRSNDVFLEYFGGPFQCSLLRHAKATDGQIKGNYGKDADLSASNGNSYDVADNCDPKYRLPGMQEKDYGSTSWDTGGTLTLLGDNYRGIHPWGAFDHTAKAGMMFARDLSSEEPYLFRARHDGAYGPLPQEGASNVDWTSTGKGYPIINDLYFRNQKVYEWEERNNSKVNIGDYFIYHNKYNNDTEFFKIKRRFAGSFPVDKTDNQDWAYVGRYPREGENLSPELPVHHWDAINRTAKKGWLYYSDLDHRYFIAKKDGEYWYYPSGTSDNEWWQFVGYHR